MPNSQQTLRQRKRLQAKVTGVTNNLDAFEWVAKNEDRINIVVEGDSWFAYPKEWLIFGPNSNVIDNIFTRLTGKGLVNTLCIAANGHTAKEMLSGKQLQSLTQLLKKRGALIELFLFSAGGNDVVGKKDLPPLLNQYSEGFSAADCLKTDKFAAKLDDISSRYEKLISLRDNHAPNMNIICHTYDILKPSEVGAEFLWGVEVMKPWIYPHLVNKNIPEHLHIAIVKLLLEGFKERVEALQNQTQGFFVVDTHGTLEPGKKADWINELHPTASGFKKIARKIYSKMKELHPQLPGFG